MLSYVKKLPKKNHSDESQNIPMADVIDMLGYLIDHISFEFGGQTYQQTIGKPMALIVRCCLPFCFCIRMRLSL